MFNAVPPFKTFAFQERMRVQSVEQVQQVKNLLDHVSFETGVTCCLLHF